MVVLMSACVEMQGNPDPLNSAFHLTYNMVLNLLRVEEINPEYMLERSFYQFQNYASIPALVDSMYLLAYVLAQYFSFLSIGLCRQSGGYGGPPWRLGVRAWSDPGFGGQLRC